MIYYRHVNIGRVTPLFTLNQKMKGRKIMTDLRFLSYGAEVLYHTKKAGFETKTFSAIVISEINSKEESSRVNVVGISKNSSSRFDVRLEDNRFARCGFGFSQIYAEQIDEIVGIHPRYETEEIHINALKATLGGVSEQKADELFTRAIQSYIVRPIIINRPEPAEVPEPVDLDKTTDPLVLQSLSVAAIENMVENAASVVETTTNSDIVKYITEFDEVLTKAESSGLTLDELYSILEELSEKYGYKSLKAALSHITKQHLDEVTSKRYEYLKNRYMNTKRRIRYEAAKSQCEAEPEKEVAEETKETEKKELELTPYELAKFSFRKTCRAKTLESVSKLEDTKAVLNDLYFAPDLSEFAKAYRFKKNREKLIAKIRTLCFSHGLSFTNEIAHINDNRAKVGLDKIIEV